MGTDARLGGGVAIVDDEYQLVDIYRNILQMRGIPVCFVAYDGSEAVRQFAQCNPKPGVVLMDYRMPTMDGIQAMREILNISQTKVVFISADEGVREEACRAGAVMFLQKPASIRDIITAVETAAAMQVCSTPAPGPI